MCRGTSAKRGRAVEQGRNRVRAAIVPSGPAWKRGHEWELHGTRLRLQGMAHLPGVKLQVQIAVCQGFAGSSFSPETSPEWSPSSAAWFGEEKASLGFFDTETCALCGTA